MANKYPIDSKNFLYDIMNDLYGNLGKGAVSAEEMEQARAAVAADFAAEGAKMAAEKAVEQPAAEPQVAEAPVSAVPELPSFESFWRTADETVDWTDALVHAEPTDGLT